MLPNQDNIVSNFVQKAFEILKIPEYSYIIQWLHNGREFVIREPEIFEQIILPKYFRHRNVNSFIRQLNMYGFNKSRREPTKLIFSHPFFLEGKQELLIQVRRKIKLQKKQENRQQSSKQNKLQLPFYKLSSQTTRPGTILKQKTSVIDLTTPLQKTNRLQNLSQQQQPQNNSIKQELSLCAINSFFNLNLVEDDQMKNLISKSFVQINPQIYQKIGDVPSLKEIGTEDYLHNHQHEQDFLTIYENGGNLEPNFQAIKIFQTKNYLFDI